jgi:hypothetical protein
VCSQCRQRLRSFVRGSAGEPGSIARHANDPSHQAPPLRSFAARSRSCIDAFPWRDVPLPTRAFAAWSNEWSFPLARSTALLGFISALRRFAPATGDRSFLTSRAHVPVRPIAPPRFIFVGLIAPLAMEIESQHERRRSRAIGLASGLTPVCGPFPKAPGPARCSPTEPSDRSCLGLCLSQGCGHRCAFGRARPRPDHQTPRAHDLMSRQHPSSAPGLTSARDCAANFPSALCGLDALPLRTLSSVARTGSLSEFSHLP